MRTIVPVVLIAATFEALSYGQSAPATTKTRFADPVVTLAQSDCTAAKLGDTIAPRWIPATDVLPARCEVDGRIASAVAGSTAPAINFRVWLPAEWNRRAVQQGGGGMNGVIPD